MNTSNFEELYDELDDYESKGIIERAYDTLEGLGIYGEDHIIEFFADMETADKIAEFLQEYSDNALYGLDPVDHIEDRAKALEYLINWIKDEKKEKES